MRKNGLFWRSPTHRAAALLLLAGVLLTGTANGFARGTRSQVHTPSHSPVQITVWQGWSGDEAKAFHALVAKFNASQQDIQVTTLDNVDYQKLLTAVSGGTSPDVAELFGDNIGTFANNGVIQPIDSLVQSAGINTDAYFPAALASGEFQGKLYGIPFMNDAIALYWNKDLFKAAGLDPNQPPKTLSELDQIARKLEKVDPSGKIERLGIDPTPSFLMWELTWDYGGDFASTDGTMITANTAAAVKAMQWQLSYVQRLGAKNIAAFQSAEGQYASPANPFFRGQLGMRFDGEWLQAFVQRYAPYLHYGVTAFPYPDAMPRMQGTAWLDGGLWVLPKGSPHPAEAMTFIKWLTNNVGNQVQFANTLANLPTLAAARSSSSFVTRHPYNQFFLKLASGRHAHYFPVTAITTQYQNDLSKADQDVIFGKATPQQALARVQSKDQAALNSALGKGGNSVP